MTTEELKKALSQESREKVDVNLGQVSLRSTVSRGGQYNVVPQATPKQNSLTRLATALNQLPQIAGQFKNIQEQAGIEKVQAMDPNEIKAELERRAENGDEEAGSFIYDLFQKEAVDEELYRQVLKTQVIPELQAIEAQLANASPAEMNKIMSSSDPLELIKKKYQDAIPSAVTKMVENHPHQKALHNEMLRRIPGLSGKTHATLIEKREKFTETTTRDNILYQEGVNVFDVDNPPMPVDDDGEIPPLPGDPVPDVTISYTSGGSMLPSSDPFETEPKDQVISEEKPKLPRVPINGPSIRPASLDAMLKPPKSELNSLEQFMAGSADYVSVAGNPAQLGNDSILSEVSVVDETGKVLNLENVPIKVEAAASKTTPEGVFKLVSEGKLQPQEDGSYIKDGTDESVAKDQKPVKLTPKQEVELSVNTITKQRKAVAKSVNAQNNAKYLKGVEAIKKGIFKNTDAIKWRKDIEAQSLDMLQANVRENLDEIDTFLEQVQDRKLTLNGRSYSDDYITKLQRIVDAEERRREYADDPLGEELADKHKMRIADIIIASQKSDVTKEEVDDGLAKEIANAYQLYRTSQIGEKERDEIIAEATQAKELIARYGLNDDNVDFYALMDNRRSIFEGIGARDLKQQYTDPDAIVAKWEQLGKDVSGLKVTVEDDWGNTVKDAWNKILWAAPLEAWQDANARAERDVIKEFAKRGYKKARVFDLQNEQGETVGIKAYYRDLVEKYYTEEAGKISDKALADLRQQANDFRSGKNISDLQRDAGVTVLDTPERAAAKVAKALEQQQQDTDLLDEKGRIVPTMPDETTAQALDRFNKTMEDEVAREAMLNSNSNYDRREKALQQIYRKTEEPSYYRTQAFKSAKFVKDQDFPAEEKHNAEVVARNKYIGLPMSVHRNGATIRYEGFTPSGNRRLSKSIPAYALNLNPPGVDQNDNRLPPLYERKETPKTHIYSYYAAREGAYNEFDKLDELFALYFKGGTEEERQQFRTDQVELARKVGFGLPAKEEEDNTK